MPLRSFLYAYLTVVLHRVDSWDASHFGCHFPAVEIFSSEFSQTLYAESTKKLLDRSKTAIPIVEEPSLLAGMRRHLCWLRHTHHCFWTQLHLQLCCRWDQQWILDFSRLAIRHSTKSFMTSLGALNVPFPLLSAMDTLPKPMRSSRPGLMLHEERLVTSYDRIPKFTKRAGELADIEGVSSRLNNHSSLTLCTLTLVQSCSNRSSVPRRLTNSPFLPSTFSPCPLQLSLLLKIDHLSNCRT